MASNESYVRIRANKFSTKHVFGQKKKGQQLWDARANRKFVIRITLVILVMSIMFTLLYFALLSPCNNKNLIFAKKIA